MGARRRGQGGHVTLRTHAAEENALRDAVREDCAGYPLEYWRGLEPDRYPDAFVKAMTEAGLLAVLIPQEYGGSGLGLEHAAVILEEGNAAGGNASACPAPMYTMGTLLRHGSEDQKRGGAPPPPGGRGPPPAVGGAPRAGGAA